MCAEVPRLHARHAVYDASSKRPDIRTQSILAACAETPRLHSRNLDVEAAYINGCTGLDLKAGKMAELLSRMALSAQPSADGSCVHVQVPPTRSDVLHPCDVMEVHWSHLMSPFLAAVPWQAASMCKFHVPAAMSSIPVTSWRCPGRV